MIARILTVALLLTVVQTGWSAADLTAYPYLRDVKTADRRDALAGVELPAAIYAELNDSMSNLRFIDSAGYAVVHRTQPATDTRTIVTTQKVGARIDKLVIGDGNEIEVLVQRTDDKESVNAIRIETGLKDYEQTIHIYSRPTSDAAWEPLVKKALVFDYSRFMNVRQNRVDFPATTHPEFRLVIEKPVGEQLAANFEVTDRNSKTTDGGFAQTRRMVEERPFHVDGVTLLRDSSEAVANQVRRMAYPAKSSLSSIDPKTAASVTILEMGREPVSSIVFVSEESNFSRTVRVAVEEPTPTGVTWREVGVSRIYRIGTAPFQQSNLTVDFAELRPGRLQVTIENGELAPIQFTRLTPEGIIYQAQFIVPKDGVIQMYYGGRSANETYDTSPIDRLYAAGTAVTTLAIGEQASNPASAPPSGIAAALNHPAVFVIAIAVMVIALGWSLFRAARNLPPPEAE